MPVTQHATISLAGEIYFVHASLGVEEVRRRFARALRRGGAFVSLPLAGGREITFLISKGLRFHIGSGELEAESETP